MTAAKRLAMLLKDPARTLRYARATADRRRTPPILCPSIGRVGSTLLWQALVSSRARSVLGRYHPTDWLRISRMRWRLRHARFPRGTVTKTHDLPYDLKVQGPLNIVFLFGRPSDVVLSVLRCRESKGQAWIDDHLRHMNAAGRLDDVLDRDVLRLEEQVDAWLALRGVNILSLKYETLWENCDRLSAFVGYEVRLPDRSERGFDDLDPATVARARATYAALDAQVAALPDYQLIREGVQ